MMKIQFQGAEYLLCGDSLDEGGPIATPEQYSHGQTSYAYLKEDGRICRFEWVIGRREDITVLAEDVPAPDVSDDAFENVFSALFDFLS